jgi:predicted transcriptional regulator YdeE
VGEVGFFEGLMKKIWRASLFVVIAVSQVLFGLMHKGTGMNYSRVSQKALSIIGVELRTTNAEGKAFQDIPAFWRRVQEEDLLAAVPAVADQQKIYAIYTDYSPDGAYAMIIGKQVSSLATVPAGMVSCTIPAGNYALFTAQGAEFALAVGAEWSAIWQMPLERAFSCDFEVYDAALLSKPVPEVPIYVALK